jgi:hypothetical protein
MRDVCANSASSLSRTPARPIVRPRTPRRGPGADRRRSYDFQLQEENEVITKTDLRERPAAPIGQTLLFREPASAPAATQAYSEIELSVAGRRDFDAGTVAIVAGIVIFKLLMLSVLFVAL